MADIYTRRRKDPKLPHGVVKALKGGWRIPEDVDEDLCRLADSALERIADVMNEAVDEKRQSSVLKAAIAIRDEVCGPVVRRVDVSGRMGLGALLADVGRLEAGEVPVAADQIVDAPVVAVLPPGAPQGEGGGAATPQATSASLEPPVKARGPAVRKGRVAPTAKSQEEEVAQVLRLGANFAGLE